MINKAAIQLVMSMEKFMPEPYDDFGHKAIGYGRRDGFRGFKITPGMKITEEQAYVWLRSDLYYLASKILLVLGETSVTDNQMGALASFSYNLGVANLARSTLMKKLKAGDIKGAADEFLKWNKAKVGGVRKELGGLTKRRKLERDLFLSTKEN